MTWQELRDTKPEPKDWQRAVELILLDGKANPYGVPYTSNAAKMAKLIKDPYKLVRRAKAVAATWGSQQSALIPFIDALREKLGLKNDDLAYIKAWKEGD